jgi:hypothetical protein
MFDYLLLLKTGNREEGAKNVRCYWREFSAENDEKAVEKAKEIASKNIGRIIHIICKDRGESAFVNFD